MNRNGDGRRGRVEEREGEKKKREREGRRVGGRKKRQEGRCPKGLIQFPNLVHNCLPLSTVTLPPRGLKECS